MKTANELPRFNVKRFMGLAYPVLEANVIYAALELDLFRYLSNPKTAEELAAETGYHPRNTMLLLKALVSLNYLIKKGDKYQNQPDTDYYLNSNGEMYIGDHIIYWRDMTNLSDARDLVKDGPKEKTFSDENGSDFFDFRSMGRGTLSTMYTGRIQGFVSVIKIIFKSDEPIKILDLGGGTGIMSIEMTRILKNSRAVIFDQPHVIELTREIIREYAAEEQVETREGNFVTDAIGSGYDFVIACGVMDFVGELSVMAAKLYRAMNDNGLLYVSTHGMNDEMTGPTRYVLGWLSSHLNGLDILKPDSAVRKALLGAGFKPSGINCGENTVILRK